MSDFTRVTYDEGISTIRSFFGKEKEKESISIYATKSKLTMIDKRWYLHSFIPPIPSYYVYNLIYSLQNVAQGKRELINVDLNVTGRCHCRCHHCFRTKSKSDLPLDQIQKLLDSLYRLRIVNLEITGGEALLRDDLEEIIARGQKVGNIIFYTTGHGLTIEKAKSLKQAGVHIVIISLDHYTSKLHNLRRRYKEAFSEALKAVEIFNSLGIYTVVTVIPMGELVSEEGMYKYLDFTREIGANEVRVGMPVPMGRLFGQDFMKVMKEFRAKLFTIRDKINQDTSYPTVFLFQSFESGEIMGCGAGFFYCAINNSGDVYPCVAVPLSFGNVYKEDFETIWERMGNYFKTPGATCFGRKLSAVLSSMMTKMEDTIKIEDLEKVKDKLIVNEKELPNVFMPFK